MSQDIVLVSNASMDIFPDNKLSDFRVRLPQPIVLDPGYRVALTRISFTKSYFNFEAGYGHVILSETGQDYVPLEADAKKCNLRLRLIPGYYTPETLIDMINIQIKRRIKIQGTNEGGIKIKDDLEYELTNGFLVTRHGTLDVGGKGTIRWSLKFDEATQKILGINDPNSTRPVFVNQGFTDLYVYSDLVYPSVVGDTTCELLTILDGQTERPYGSHCCEVWDDPWFHKLAKTTFSEIRVYIRSDTGKAPKFRFGRVCLRLSFKREDAI